MIHYKASASMMVEITDIIYTHGCNIKVPEIIISDIPGDYSYTTFSDI